MDGPLHAKQLHGYKRLNILQQPGVCGAQWPM